MHQQSFPIADYDLAATLSSGQSFRWKYFDGAWEGVIGSRWVRLTTPPGKICAATMEAPGDWQWLKHYLQLDFDLAKAISSFPEDVPLQRSVAACAGLRLLRQDPWECLASFILSSTKQIVQIQQIVRNLSECMGDAVLVPEGSASLHEFPNAQVIAGASETQLRGCKMGFRAPNLKKTAEIIASGHLNLDTLNTLSLSEARHALVQLPGVGPKIADCVLLFAYDFPKAFPIDVWVRKALKQLYFPRRRKISDPDLRQFTENYFGPYAGLAQQYLFHYMRTKHP